MNGLNPKYEEINDKLNDFKPSIVFLQETERNPSESKNILPGYRF